MDDHPYLRRLCDGTVKQLSPFTGTEVWTVPGRANRPLRLPQVEVRPLTPHMHTHTCAFCSGRYLETPPEYARIVRFASVKDDDDASADAGARTKASGANARLGANTGAGDTWHTFFWLAA